VRKKQLFIIVSIFILIAGYFGLKRYASNVAKKRVDITIDKMKDYIDVKYKDVSVDIFRMNVHISDVIITLNSMKKININELIVNDFVYHPNIEQYFDIECDGLKLEFNDRDMLDILYSLGYNDKINIDARIIYHYNTSKKQLEIKKIMISADNIGELELSCKFNNIYLNPDDPLKFIFSLSQIMLSNASIKYHDDSLAKRIMLLSSAEANKDIKQYKDELIKKFESDIKMAKDRSIKKSLKALENFIISPNNIAITIAPKRPLPLGEIENIKDIKQLIKVLNAQVQS